MSDPVQVIPFLSAFSDDGEFTVRVDDSPLAKVIAPAIIKVIGQENGARKLTLLTPSDTKIFKFGNGSSKSIASPGPEPLLSPARPTGPARPVIEQDLSTPPSPETAEYDAEMREAMRLQREIEKQNSEEVQFPETEETPSDKPPVRRKRSPRPESAPSSTCGRCAGEGKLLGGGTCPVCRGRGSVAHFGRAK